MPFAFAAAIGTVAVAAVDVAAVGITIGTALEVVAAVGAVISVVGKVTGDKDLMKAGMIVGAVGGIGALASSAGLFNGATQLSDLFGSSSSAAAAGDAIPASIGVTPEVFGTHVGSYVDPAFSGAATGGATQGLLNANTSSSGATTAAPSSGPPTAGSALDNWDDLTLGSSKASNAAGYDDLTLGGASKPPAPVTGAGAVTSPPPVAPTVPGSPVVKSATAAEPAKDASVLDDFWNYAKTPGGGFMIASGVQALGSFIGGATDPAIAAQADLNRLKLANMQARIPVASKPGITVTGKPATAQPTAAQITGAPVGLINRPATVTGAPL